MGLPAFNNPGRRSTFHFTFLTVRIMLLEILNNPRAFGPLEIIFLAIACLVIGVVVTVILLRERARTAAQQVETPTAPTTGGFKWRKAAPVLLFVGLAALFVVLGLLINRVPALGEVVQPASGGVLPDVDGGVVETKAAVGGYVQFGGFFSKVLVMVAVYSLFSFYPWVLQQLTHPAIAKWKKTQYSDDFNTLSPELKFLEARGVGLSRAIIAAACILGACFIQ